MTFSTHLVCILIIQFIKRRFQQYNKHFMRMTKSFHDRSNATKKLLRRKSETRKTSGDNNVRYKLTFTCTIDINISRKGVNMSKHIEKRQNAFTLSKNNTCNTLQCHLRRGKWRLPYFPFSSACVKSVYTNSPQHFQVIMGF